MADITIPNLPQVTATTDLDILVITDSGETTTSKITKSDFLSGVGGKLVDGIGINSIATIGNESSAVGERSLFIARNNTGNGVIQARGGVIIEGFGNSSKILNNSLSASIIVSDNSEIRTNNSNHSNILGGFNHIISNSEASGIWGGRNSNISNASKSYIIGSDYAEITASASIIINGFQSKIFASGGSAIIRDQYAEITNDSRGSSIAFGNWRLAQNFRNRITNSWSSQILGGNKNLINIGTTSSNSWEHAMIIGSTESTIDNGKLKTLMLNTHGKTAVYSGYAHTDNFYVYSHQTYQTYSGVSVGNEQIFDADKGMVQYFDNPAGNLNIRTVNVKNGEVYDMIIGGDGGVIIDSVGVNDVGFTAVDNTSAASGSYMHLRIAVVNDLVVFSTL